MPDSSRVICSASFAARVTAKGPLIISSAWVAVVVTLRSAVLVKLSTRPANRVGSDEVWDKAEAALEQALNSKGLEWQLQPGEGAFYGPKIEFSLKDTLGRVWQCGTIQLDFNLPVRLGVPGQHLSGNLIDAVEQPRVATATARGCGRPPTTWPR